MKQGNKHQSDLSVIVVAAGTGKRMQSPERKQFMKIFGVPILAMSLKIFENHSAVSEIILVSPNQELERVRNEILVVYGYRKVKHLVAGGSCRKESVLAGLLAVAPEVSWIAVHDGARPLLTTEVFDRVFEKAVQTGGAIPAVPVTDTLKKGDVNGLIAGTLPRDHLWLAQTPQIFRADWLRNAYKKLPDQAVVTDDASVLEMAGYPVHLTTGSWENLKITLPDDLLRAERILEGRR